MPILNPSENITGIISLIENAKKFVVMVSPYSNLEGWDRLKNAINKASESIEVTYYVREGQGSKGIEDLNVKIYEVPMLHCKMFFNEREVIISSFHLMNNSDINWAYRLNNQEEYNELVTFFEQYVKPLAKLRTFPVT
jgi:hypothetical protein